MRKSHHKSFKFKVAIKAIRRDLTISQIVSHYQVAESLVHRWKKQVLEQGMDIFDNHSNRTGECEKVDIQKLHAKIGQLTLERDFLESALLRNPSKSARK